MREKGRVCVCVQDTEMLMPLLWALSSTLSISVYNVKRGEVPAIGGVLKAGESMRKTEAEGTLFCFGKAFRTVCLNLWRTNSPHGQVPVCDVIHLD